MLILERSLELLGRPYWGPSGVFLTAQGVALALGTTAKSYSARGSCIILQVVHRYDLPSYLVKKVRVLGSIGRDFSHTARRSGSSGAIFYTVTSWLLNDLAARPGFKKDVDGNSLRPPGGLLLRATHQIEDPGGAVTKFFKLYTVTIYYRTW